MAAAVPKSAELRFNFAELGKKLEDALERHKALADHWKAKAVAQSFDVSDESGTPIAPHEFANPDVRQFATMAAEAVHRIDESKRELMTVVRARDAAAVTHASEVLAQSPLTAARPTFDNPTFLLGPETTLARLSTSDVPYLGITDFVDLATAVEALVLHETVHILDPEWVPEELRNNVDRQPAEVDASDHNLRTLINCKTVTPRDPDSFGGTMPDPSLKVVWSEVPTAMQVVSLLASLQLSVEDQLQVLSLGGPLEQARPFVNLAFHVYNRLYLGQGLVWRPGGLFLVPQLLNLTALQPADRLYEVLRRHYMTDLESVSKLVGTHLRVVPPLLAIVLSRCEKPSDLIRRVLELRDEAAPMRAAVARIRADLGQASTFREHLHLIQKIEESEVELARKLAKARKPRQSLVHRLWGYAKSASLWQITTKALDDLLEFDRQRQVLSVSHFFIDAYDALADGEAIDHIARLYGEDSANVVADRDEIAALFRQDWRAVR